MGEKHLAAQLFQIPCTVCGVMVFGGPDRCYGCRVMELSPDVVLEKIRRDELARTREPIVGGYRVVRKQLEE